MSKNQIDNIPLKNKDATRMDKMESEIGDVANLMRRFAIDELFGEIVIKIQAGIVKKVDNTKSTIK